MKKNINKQQFLELCFALESEIITTEQFYTLSSKDHDMVIAIIGVLKLLKTKDNNIMFNTLCDSPNYNDIYQIIKKYKVYQTDSKRQQFIIENHDNVAILLIASLLQNDSLWNDKEVVRILLDKSTRILDFLETYREISDFLAKNDSLCVSTQNMDIIKKILREESDNIRVLLSYLSLESLRENPIWFDYLINYYRNEQTKVNYSSCFTSYEEAGCMEKLTQKLMKINKNENSRELFSNFFRNIISIRDFSLKMTQKEQEQYQREFDILLQHSTDDKDDFPIVRDLVEFTVERNLNSNELNDMYQKIIRCKAPNVRAIVMEIYRNYSSNFITDNVINQIAEMTYDEAQTYLLNRAIEINEQAYITKMKDYYGESFSESFIRNISKETLSKEELLVIRNSILKSSSTFDGQNFVIDTTSIIEEPVKSEEPTDDSATVIDQQPSIIKGPKMITIKNRNPLKAFFNKLSNTNY